MQYTLSCFSSSTSARSSCVGRAQVPWIAPRRQQAQLPRSQLRATGRPAAATAAAAVELPPLRHDQQRQQQHQQQRGSNCRQWPGCAAPPSSAAPWASSSSGSAPGRHAVRCAAAVSALTPYPSGEHVWVPFKPDFYSSQPVQIQGSFNDWSGPFALHHDPTTGKVGGVLRLEAHHAVISFKYQVGDKWFLSREDASTADEQGCVNNSTAGRQTVRFSFPSALFGAASGLTPASCEVHLIGSFTDWQVSIPLALGPDGNFHADVALTPGHHTFRYLVDASAGPTHKQPATNGSSSSSSSYATASLMGTLPLALQATPGGSSGGGGGGGTSLALSAGAAVDRRARWTVVDWMPVETQPGGMKVNSVRVPPPAMFKVLYHTHFSEAYIHYRVKGEESFRRARMYHQPDCLGLMVAQLPSHEPAAQLEFSITGSAAKASASGSASGGDSAAASLHSSWDDEGDVWDAAHKAPLASNGSSSAGGSGSSSSARKALPGDVVRDPPSGSLQQLYCATHPGVWRLKDGALSLDEAGQLAPIMLCTDLDGTLIEDQADNNDWVRAADDATRAAASYFGQYIAPCGGVIVFNTGRSIGLVEGLLNKKAGIMPRPHAIITAVGTKVFLWDVATESWVSDPGYALLLADGWDADKVSALAQDLRNRNNGQVSIVDDGSEHPHRLSMSMRGDMSDRLTHKWSEALNKEGVAHQMVASIGGEWRYVDCISAHAGKGRAMMYVASRYGITPGDVVAAGDSGNDLLMLGPVDGQPHPAIIMSNSHPEVWDWLRSISPEERTFVYTPKAERAGGLVEGLRAILRDKLAAQASRLQKSGGPMPPQLRSGGAGAAGSSSSTSAGSSLRMLRG